MGTIMKRKKAVAWLVMLTFLFTCIMPSGTLLAAANDQQIEAEGGESSDSNVTISKVISGTEKENYFDITLTVKTPQAMEELIKTVPTDVVIVMDISNTMGSSIMSNNKSRLENAKTAAKQFIDDYKAMMGDSGRLGIVTFNTHAQKVKDLSTDNAASLKNAINGIQASPNILDDKKRVRFTNIEAGLKLAQNMLNASNRAEQEYIILLTDGFPTTYIKSGGNSTKSIIGHIPYTSDGSVGADGVFYNQKLGLWCKYGVDYSDKGAARAQALAQTIKSNINIFTIGIGDHTINGYTPSRGSGTDRFSTIDCYNNNNAYVISSEGYDAATDANAYKKWLENKIGGGPDMAGKTTFADGTNLAALKNAYTSIFQTIKEVNIKKVQDTYIASDPMGADVEFQYFYNKNGNKADDKLTGSHAKYAEDTAVYDADTDKINWTLLQSGYTTTKEGTTTYYHYNIKYRVRLENEKNGFAEHTDKVTNGTTTLKYKVNDNGNISDEKSLNFPVPAVEGYLTNLEFTKTDALTGAGLAGAAFTLTHNADNCSVCKGDATIAEQQTTSGTDGKVTFTNIPSGHEYTLTETAVPNGYEKAAKTYNVKVAYDVLTITNADSTFNGTVFANKPVNTSVKVEKVWEDTNNQDGIRPDSITVKLFANGNEEDEVTLNAANNWTYTWTGLAAYRNGEAVSYTVDEANVPAGYTSVITGDAAVGYTITNTYEVEKTSVSGTKTWNDNNNQDGIRPDSITVTLMNGNQVVDSKVVTAADGWAYAFTNLDKYANGTFINYTIVETAVAGYETKVNGYDIVNTHVPDTTEVTISKVWADNNNQDGKRPESITVNLLANGIKVDSATVTGTGSEWTYTFTDLPKYENGEAIVYTVTEDAVENYATAIDGYTITNTYTTEITSVSGTKTWIDGNSAKRPGEITVNLLADGEVVDSKRVTELDNWTYQFTNLPKYENGALISYTVQEEPVDGYVTSYDGNNITNTIEQKYFGISGTKTWNVPEGTVLPESITVVLKLKDGTEVARQEVTEADNWAYSFDNLKAYDARGNMYHYTVEEIEVAGYATSYDVNNDNEANRIVNITNTLVDITSPTVTIEGNKFWNAPENITLPESITINLLQNGTVIDSAAAVAETGWAYSFKDLPRFDADGSRYAYTVEEVPVDGYVATVTRTADGFDITNTYYVGEAGSFNVSKVVSGGDEMIPADDTEYTFRLKVKATVAEWTALLVHQKGELEDAKEIAEIDKAEAEQALLDAEAVFRANAKTATTGSAYDYNYQYLMVGDKVESTSGSAYELTGLLENGRVMTTTGSAYALNNAVDVDDNLDILDRIIAAIKAMVNRIRNFHDDVFIDMLSEEVQSTTASALMFQKDDVVNLIEAERNVQNAAERVAEAERAYSEFIASDVTTSTAIKLVLTPTAGGEAIELDLNAESAQFDKEENVYVVDFKLQKDTGYNVAIEAAEKGTEIEYSISEIDWETENFVKTEITINGNEKAKDERYVGERKLDNTTADTYVFHNIYDENPDEPDDPTPPDDPDDPPYTPPYNPPDDPEDPPEVPDTPDEPVVIEEPDVPLVDIPGEIIDEEDIPLGDAPPTGDNANAIPFVMMMAIAAAGMVITRRRFN